jgi:diguanylate cyclase (GGDEF)-like protein
MTKLKFWKDNKKFGAILLFFSLLWIIVVTLIITSNFENRSELVNIETLRTEEHYDSVLNILFSKIDNIEVYVKTVGVDGLTQENFDEFAEKSNFDNIGFISFSIAPAGTIAYYYSWDYDDDIVGLDLINDERDYVREAVIYAIDNQVVVINGPFDLIQGGEGLVFRKPVFEDGEFVAIINLVIEYDNLNVLFTESQSEIVDVGIFTGNNELLFGNLVYSDNLLYSKEIDLPYVDWNMGIEISDDYIFKFRVTNLVILHVAAILYLTTVILGTKYYKNINRLLVRQDELINFDNLTSLPNRRLLERDIDIAIREGKPFYLGFGDLDNFKNLNDILGHSIGDKYLKDISNRFHTIIADDLKIYRWGGDEFIFLMYKNNREDTIEILNSIYGIFEEPIIIKDVNYKVSISIGVVNYPKHGTYMDGLIKRADIVMYDIKSQQKNNFGFFEDKYLDNLRREVDFENQLNKYSLDEFEVFLQPVLHTKTQKIYGFEGLIRLFDEDNRLVNTAEIIKVFERKGEISKLDKYVFESICKHSARLKEEFGREFIFSFNISPITLSDEFIDFIEETTKKYKIDTSKLIVEIIETLGFKDFNDSIRLLKRLRSLGLRIAMDDFGMGYSSLSYITKLPLSIIKIDRFFTNNYQSNEFDKLLILTIMDISKSLQIEVIVEGIETVEQLKFISEIDAHYFQGYLHSKATNIDNIIKSLKENKYKL